MQDEVWIRQCKDFITDNPEFLPYQNLIPPKRNFYDDFSTIRDFLIWYIVKKEYDFIYKFTFVSEDYDFDMFEEEFFRLIDDGFFAGYCTMETLFSIYNEVEIRFNNDVECFKMYGLYTKGEENENKVLINDWMRERKFITGMEKIYNININNAHSALKIIEKWKRNIAVGYTLCMLV